MVYRGDNIEFEFPVTRGLEDSCVDLDLLDSGAVEFFESRDNPRFLACARWSVYKEVREVATLCLLSSKETKHISLLSCSDNDGLTCPLPTTSTVRKDHDDMKDHRGFVAAVCPQAKP